MFVIWLKERRGEKKKTFDTVSSHVYVLQQGSKGRTVLQSKTEYV